MALTIVLMLLFAASLVVRDFKNKYSLLFALMALAMGITLFTVVIEIHRGSNYYVSSNFLFSGLEARVFFALNRILRLPVSSLLILRNLGLSIYFLMNLLFILSFGRNIRTSSRQKSKRVYVIPALMGLYIILYNTFYHPDIAYRFYLYWHTLPEGAGGSFQSILNLIDTLMTVFAYLYLLYPLFFLVYHYSKKHLTLFWEQLLSLLITLAMLNIAFLVLFFQGTFRTSSTTVLQQGFWRSINVAAVPRYYSSLLPIVAFGALLVLSYILIRFQTVNLVAGLRERQIKKGLRGLNANLRDVMHSEKNLLFNVQILADQALEAYGTEEGRQKLARIRELSDSQLQSIARTLDSIKTLRIQTLNQDFFWAIEQALQAHPLPENVRLVTQYNCATAHCNYDIYHMTQVIVNLLANAVTGLQEAQTEDPCITLTVDISDNWVYFSVHDNGCGIPRRQLAKIFQPYVSLRARQGNWGVGLSYVARVIKSHLGHIRISSKQHSYTLVEILLTRSWKGSRSVLEHSGSCSS